MLPRLDGPPAAHHGGLNFALAPGQAQQAVAVTQRPELGVLVLSQYVEELPPAAGRQDRDRSAILGVTGSGYLVQAQFVVTKGEQPTSGLSCIMPIASPLAEEWLVGHGGHAELVNMDIPTIIRTLHTYPLVFSNTVLSRRGTESKPAGADPRRGDLLRSAS